jgi:hypothetical protein
MRSVWKFGLGPLCLVVVATASAASCADWGDYAHQVAEMRNGGLTQSAAETHMWDAALSGALDGAKNETHFDGFEPNRAKTIILDVYSTHHAPSFYGISVTEECHAHSWLH